MSKTHLIIPEIRGQEMSQRRSFLRQLSGLFAGGFVMSSNSLRPNSGSNLKTQLARVSTGEQFWRFVRQQFPLTEKKTYLNNGTMGPCPHSVMEVVNTATVYSNTEASYGGGEVAREHIAKFIHAKKEEISLTHNATEGINLIVWGLPLKKGDEVILTTHEHVGMATPWLNRAKLHGIVLKPFVPGSTAHENLNRINDMITRKTRVIAVPHITCTNGLVLPAMEISQLAQDKGLFSFFDGAHAPGSLVLNMNDMNCDFYAACGHKWLLAPLGTGFMYIKEGLLDVLQTFHVGGHAISDGKWELSEKRQDFTEYVPTAHRYDYGTQNPALHKGMASAIEFFNTIGIRKAVNRGNTLAKYLQDNLLKLEDSIEMLTPTEAYSRASMIGFRINKMDYREFGKLAHENRFTIRLVWEGAQNCIRISTHLYNSYQEVDRFLALVKSVA